MPDIGWMELLVIGIVALIVVGPEDLPKMFRKLGQMMGRVRGMAKEFTNAMNAAADESGMTEMSRDLRAASKFTNPKKMARDMMGDVMDDIDPTKFEEGSATRIIAEKKLAAQQETREKIAAIKAAKAAETSAEPEIEPQTGPQVEPQTGPQIEPGPRVASADPGPALVEDPAAPEPDRAPQAAVSQAGRS